MQNRVADLNLSGLRRTITKMLFPFLQVDETVEHPDKLHLASWCGDEKEVRNMINKAGNEKYYNVIYM